MYQPLTCLVAKILGLENQNMWHRLNFFAVKIVMLLKKQINKFIYFKMFSSFRIRYKTASNLYENSNIYNYV